jgi:hypothetical protein
MKYKVRTVKVPLEIRRKSRIIYETWQQALEQHTDREGTRMAPELKSDTKPLIKNSLAHAICNWIEQNPDTWVNDWATILHKISEGDKFLHKGYGNLRAPNLAWLFGHTKNSDLGINRVIDGTQDLYKNRSHWDDGE